MNDNIHTLWPEGITIILHIKPMSCFVIDLKQLGG